MKPKIPKALSEIQNSKKFKIQKFENSKIRKFKNSKMQVQSNPGAKYKSKAIQVRANWTAS